MDRSAAAALVGHFLDPGTPNPARGCPAPELVPARLRTRLRGWRERHHPESIEKRHRTSVADRRVEFSPDRDGMAWFSAYLRADQALAINNDLTATARSLRGPHETRALTQLKADDFARRLLTNRTAHASAPDPSAPEPTAVSLEGEGGVEGWGGAAEDLIGLATVVGSDESLADLGISDEPATEFNTFAGDNLSSRPATETGYTATGTTPNQAEPVLLVAPAWGLKRECGGQEEDVGGGSQAVGWR